MKRKSWKRIPIVAMAVVIGTVFMSSCLKNEWEECEKDAKNEMDKYIAEKNISDQYKKDVDGVAMYYIPDTVGTGISPALDDYVVINVTGMYLDGTIIETTDSSLKSKWAAASSYKDYAYGPTKFKFGYSRVGFNQGLSYMSEGGWATLIIPTELAFYDCRPVKYTINLLSVIKYPEAYEQSIMLRYLAENGMDTIANAHHGIYYKKYDSTGDTMSVLKNDTVMIRFTGKYTYMNNGSIYLKEFDSNLKDSKPLKIVYGKDDVYGGSIKYVPNGLPDGFTAALDTMQKGTHALAVLPYKQAFGTTGLINSIYGYYIVPQYQTVIYDLYVEDIIRPTAK